MIWIVISAVVLLLAATMAVWVAYIMGKVKGFENAYYHYFRFGIYDEIRVQNNRQKDAANNAGSCN